MAAARRQTLYRPLHVLHCRTLLLKWDSSRQKLVQPPATRVRSDLQLYWRSPEALQSPRRSSLNHSSTLTRLVNFSSLHHGTLRDQGPGRLPLLAVVESTFPLLEGGVSNGRASLVLKWQNPWSLPSYLVVSNKGNPDYPPNPRNFYSVTIK